MPRLTFKPDDHPDVTFSDVFLIPNNPTEDQVIAHSDEAKRAELMDLRRQAEVQRENGSEAAMAALKAYRRAILDTAEQLGIGGIFSRDDVDLKPRGGLANTPVIIANMNNVVGRRMAESIARVGGIAAIPQDKSDKELQGIMGYLASRHPIYETPVTITPETKVHEFRRLLAKRSHGTAIVMDGYEKFAGILSERDIPAGLNEDAEVGPFIRRDELVTAQDGVTPREAIGLMDKAHVHYLPILNGGDQPIGALTLIDAAMRLRYNPNIDVVRGGLRALYTVGALNKNPLDRVRFLLDNGVRDILFDTAHFDQGTVPYRNLEKAVVLAEQRGIKANIVAGNVVTREATRNILATGAKFVKVGIGPGAMCTTRVVTGVGRPQISAVLECAEEARKYGGFVVSDGGKQHPGDVAKDLAAGADYVMMGTPFAGTYESPPDLQRDAHGLYKINTGMAAGPSSVLRTFGRSQRTDRDVFRDVVGHRSEGISEGKVYLKPGLESVALVHHHNVDGPSSTVTYEGAKALRELSDQSVIGLQTSGGFEEGKPKVVS